jgi:hypothetical protein
LNSLIGLFTQFSKFKTDESDFAEKYYLDLTILKRNNVVFITRDERSFKILDDKVSKILVNHSISPYTFGFFDQHYNVAGRMNTVNTIIPFVLARIGS